MSYVKMRLIEIVAVNFLRPQNIVTNIMLLQIRIYNLPLTQGIKDLRKPMSYMIFSHMIEKNKCYTIFSITMIMSTI